MGKEVRNWYTYKGDAVDQAGIVHHNVPITVVEFTDRTFKSVPFTDAKSVKFNEYSVSVPRKDGSPFWDTKKEGALEIQGDKWAGRVVFLDLGK